MLNNCKQTSQPYSQKHMRLILQSISYVEDSLKLLTGPLVKLRTHSFGLQSPSLIEEELLGSAKNCVLV